MVSEGVGRSVQAQDARGLETQSQEDTPNPAVSL